MAEADGRPADDLKEAPAESPTALGRMVDQTRWMRTPQFFAVMMVGGLVVLVAAYLFVIRPLTDVVTSTSSEQQSTAASEAEDEDWVEGGRTEIRRDPRRFIQGVYDLYTRAGCERRPELLDEKFWKGTPDLAGIKARLMMAGCQTAEVESAEISADGDRILNVSFVVKATTQSGRVQIVNGMTTVEAIDGRWLVTYW